LLYNKETGLSMLCLTYDELDAYRLYPGRIPETRWQPTRPLAVCAPCPDVRCRDAPVAESDTGILSVPNSRATSNRPRASGAEGFTSRLDSQPL
jgi:hypothetical protein